MWRIGALVPVLLVAFGLALTRYSQFDLRFQDVVSLVLAFDSANLNHQVLLSLRLPRALAATFVGAALAVAGLIMQGMTRNPLASPSVFGVSAGAALAFAISATELIAWVAVLPLLLVNFCGASLAGLLVFFLGGLHRTPIHPVRVVLAGVALNFLFLSMTRGAVILADENAYGVFHWLTGSLGNVTFADVRLVAPWTALGLAGALWLGQPLNLLRLGEERMQNLGGGLRQVRWLGSLVVVLLVAAAVSVAGPIGFVGLMVPHVARALIGTDYRLLVPACALLGAILLLVSDTLARGLRFPNDSPVGILTTLLGAGFFLFLARRRILEAGT
ncbi:FecCD family ABC transporter permease [Saccharospirillum impatiens]|uniref:FecCD family ABC transporter permease n=1 Tax=Saccharospirillum impatiens TaxID=169438 RepID=UPI000429CA09|nr:iron chelate uptake ABC transporter family permease subunit [Saccharospirillum impatiens]